MTYSRTTLWLGAGAVLGVIMICAVSAVAMDAYWTEPAYKQYPIQGPAATKGIVIWNNGVRGTMTTNDVPPTFLVAGLAARGWDVIKLNRNPTYENTWSNAGLKHVDRLVEEANAATKNGYQRVILGGQSYGGAIALQAADTFPAYAVIALSPGIGTSMRWFGTVVTEADSHAIAQHTYDQVEKLKAQRAVFVMSPDDELAPNLDRSPRVRELMAAKPMPYMLVDRQVHGHGGGYSAAFVPYASCAQWLLDPGLSPKPGEFRCFRDEIPAVLASVKAAHDGAAAGWFGYIDQSGEPVVVLERNSPTGRTVDFGWDRGLGTKPGQSLYSGIAIDRQGPLRFTIGARTAEIFIQPDGANMKMTLTVPGRATNWTATLVPLPPEG